MHTRAKRRAHYRPAVALAKAGTSGNQNDQPTEADTPKSFFFSPAGGALL
jgi:hypothetical protein